MTNQLAPRVLEDHKKDIVSLRHWLLGKGYHMALFIMDYAMHHHDGKRKDGTPEFNHQVSQCHYMRTLCDYLLFAEETFAAIFLHDLTEDKPVSYEELEALLKEKNKTLAKVYKREEREPFNVERLMTAVKHLTKVYKGVKMDTQEYFDNMVNNEIASVVKGGDRIHNITSMGAAFSKEKQEKYVVETETYILPMLKQAQRNNPHQNNVYENEKLVLKTQLNIIKLNLGLSNEQKNSGV